MLGDVGTDYQKLDAEVQRRADRDRHWETFNAAMILAFFLIGFIGLWIAGDELQQCRVERGVVESMGVER